MAWTGPSPRLPLRLRPLGERMVVAETGVGETWLWWREAVFDSGRAVGGVLAAARLPAAGARRVLGVWAGRAAVAAPDPAGSGVVLASGSALLRVGVRPSTPVAGSQAGLGRGPRAAHGGLLSCSRPPPAGGHGLLAGDAAARVARSRLVAGGRAGGPGAGAVVALGEAGAGAGAGLALGGLTWLLPGLLVVLDVAPGPDTLLWPGALRWTLILSMVVMLRAVGQAGPWLPLPLRLLAWVAAGGRRGAVGALARGPGCCAGGVARGSGAPVAAVGRPGRLCRHDVRRGGAAT